MTPNATLRALSVRAASLFPVQVGIGAAAVPDPAALTAAERQALPQARPARQAEFAGGRRAAALAQMRLGLVPAAVPMGADRAPVWPHGLSGSITHADGLCLAAVSAAPEIGGLGLDLEPDAPLPDDVADQVLRPEERGLPVPLVFSAKEAVFKALYPLAGEVFGFDAVTISLAPDRFRMRLQQTLGSWPAGLEAEGALSVADGYILTGLMMTRPGTGGIARTDEH